MPHRKSVTGLRVRDFLWGLWEALATGGMSLFTSPSAKTLTDLPYKLIFEISQTIGQLHFAKTTSEHHRVRRQLANETELIKQHAEDIFILLNCPHRLRIDFKRAAERMQSHNTDSQMAMMDALFQALAWDDPHRRRPKIKRSTSGQLISVTPVAPKEEH